MRKHHHEPYSNQNRLIPKDRRVALGKTHPVDYYNVSAQDIAVGQVASGSAFANPNNPPSGAGAGEGGAPGSIENLVKSINSILVSPSLTFVYLQLFKSCFRWTKFRLRSSTTW